MYWANDSIMFHVIVILSSNIVAKERSSDYSASKSNLYSSYKLKNNLPQCFMEQLLTGIACEPFKQTSLH